MNKKREKQNMKLKDITPKAYRCAQLICPAVYTTEKSHKLVIIGEKTDNLEQLGIAEKIGKNEQAVIVDREMLRQIFEK